MKKTALLFIIATTWLVLYGHGQKSRVVIVDKSNDWKRYTIRKGDCVYVKCDTALFLCLKNIPPCTPIKKVISTSLIQRYSKAHHAGIIRVKSAQGKWTDYWLDEKNKIYIERRHSSPGRAAD